MRGDLPVMIVRTDYALPGIVREVTRGALGRLSEEALERYVEPPPTFGVSHDHDRRSGGAGYIDVLAGLELERRRELDVDCEFCGDTGMVLYGDTEGPCGACYDPEIHR